MRNCCQLVPAVAATLVACGGSPTVTGTATVELDPRGGWSGTAEVLVHRGDGSLAARSPITTKLDVAVESGDTVTVAFEDGGQVRLASVTQVEPGDTIREIAGPLGTSDQRTSVDVHLPSVAGATQWSVATVNALSFGSAGGTLSIDVPKGSTAVPILAVASSGTDTLGMYGARAAAITAGTPPSIELRTAVAWGPVTPNVLHAASEPSLETEVFLGEDTLVLLPPAHAATVAAPTNFGDGVAITATDATKTDLISVGAVLLPGTPPSSIDLDVAAPALPTFTAGEAAADHVAWTATGGGDYDLLTAYLMIDKTQYAWILDAPPGSASIALPTLPADLAPTAAFDRVGVVAYERSDVDGYEAALRGGGPLPAAARWQYRSSAIKSPASVAGTPDHGKLDPRVVLAALRR